jgi:hypothetical protein
MDGIVALQPLLPSWVIHDISSVHRALPVYPRLGTYRCTATNRRFGPQGDINRPKKDRPPALDNNFQKRALKAVGQC